MTEYHVGCATTVIWAGTMNEPGDMWLTKSDVTDEAIAAVRDYMATKLLDCDSGNSGYRWKTNDGREIRLLIEIADKENEGNKDGR